MRKIMKKIASRQNIYIYVYYWLFGRRTWCFFYWDGALGVLVGILGVLVGVIDVLTGVILIQSSPFRICCGKKLSRLQKSMPTPLVALVTNIKYGKHIILDGIMKVVPNIKEIILCRRRTLHRRAKLVGSLMMFPRGTADN